jgi:hypothetical protein
MFVNCRQKNVISGNPGPLLNHCTDYTVTIRALCISLFVLRPAGL